MSEPAVQFFVPTHRDSARKLREKLEAEQEKQSAHLAGGLAEDWADYKGRVGIIRGLDIAIAACQEIEGET